MSSPPALLSRSVAIARELGAWASVAVAERAGITPGTPGHALATCEPVQHADAAAAERLRAGLERLGPVFVKLGQLLSTRPDLVSPAYTTALARLQSRVAPFPADDVTRVLRHHADRIGGDPFAWVDPRPLAAASLAQVHVGRLKSGDDVAIKLRRPGLVARVAEDVGVLRVAARLAQDGLVRDEVFDLPGTIEELSRSLEEELDFRNEAESLALFSRNLASLAPDLSVPFAHEELCTESVLVMERVRGASLGEARLERLSRARRHTLGTTLAHAVFRMSFVDGVFHADPHPGNIFLTDDDRLALLDFGMVGRIERQVGDDLVRVLLNFLLKDSHGVAHAFLDIGKPTRRADELGWISDVRRLLPRYHGMRLERLNVGAMLVDLLRSAARRGIQSPPIVALVCKALANVDGSARRIDPGIDVVGTFRSFLPTLVDAHAERVASVEQAAKVALESALAAQRMPVQISAILEKLATGRLRFEVD